MKQIIGGILGVVAGILGIILGIGSFYVVSAMQTYEIGVGEAISVAFFADVDVTVWAPN